MGVRQFAACLDEVQRPPTDRERALIALRLASPNRTPAPQHDAAHLPLFIAANEPTLF